MAAPQDDGTALVVSENNTDDSSPRENGQVEPAEGNQQAQQPARPGGWAMLKTLAIRMFFIYAITSFFRRSPTAPATTDGNMSQGPARTLLPSTNIYEKGTMMDMYIFISEEEYFTNFKNPDKLFWMEEEIVYGDWTGGIFGDGTYIKKGEIPISKNIQNNGSLYIHTYFVMSGSSPDPSDMDTYSSVTTVYRSKMLNRFKKRRYHNTVNLLTGTTGVHPDLLMKDNVTVEVLSHWHPNLTINLVDDHTPWQQGSVPSPLNDYIEFLPERNKYRPVLFYNEYWNLNSDYMPINSSTPVLNFTLTISPMSLFKWQLYAAQVMRNKWTSYFGDELMSDNEDDQDVLKQTFLETSPYLLGLTVIVSLVHSVFEFLAFKNDIQFWRNRKSLEGLSVRTVFFSVFQSLIVLLYVLDNETNFVVRVSVFIGLLIEIWKIHKVINVKIDRENLICGIVPRIRLEDKSSYTKSMTKQYDQMAFKYLSWALFPLLICYAVYSVLYQEHRGWYSWVLGMAYGFLLTFGFIMMTPQLFINYKLKSVAHLPWRMLSYKALNTFIDDLFAFVIKMPTLYRIGCFRDDIVFCIYIYQRYIYRVDPKRVNEFGISGDMFDEEGKILPPPAEDGDTSPVAAIEDTQEGSKATPKDKEEKKND
ncbi:Cleft lip and palate transmembrane protein 1-like [Lamellibrachia satsuma]|nr:Cleft lip and palate transmembrane protein 1-like [Lamellibrachia satsuma]